MTDKKAAPPSYWAYTGDATGAVRVSDPVAGHLNLADVHPGAVIQARDDLHAAQLEASGVFRRTNAQTFNKQPQAPEPASAFVGAPGTDALTTEGAPSGPASTQEGEA